MPHGLNLEALGNDELDLHRWTRGLSRDVQDERLPAIGNGFFGFDIDVRPRGGKAHEPPQQEPRNLASVTMAVHTRMSGDRLGFG